MGVRDGVGMLWSDVFSTGIGPGVLGERHGDGAGILRGFSLG